MSDIVTVAQGLSASFTVTLRDGNGNVFNSYIGTEALAGSIRVGRDTPMLVMLAPTWISAPLGTISVAIAGNMTSAVDPGRYLIELHLADNSADLYEGFIEITYSAGVTATLPTYGTFADILDRAPWIEKLQRPTDYAGFARQRYLARQWFDDLLQRHFNGSTGISTDFAFVPGISFGGLFGPGIYWRDGRRSQNLKTWLDANRLDVTMPIVDAVSNYAIGLLCDRQITPGRDDSGYASAALKYFSRAESIASCITAEIDANGDGVNDTMVRMGAYDTLRG